MDTDSPVRPPRLRKLPGDVRRAILLPVDPFGRRELGSVPKERIQSEFSLLFTRFVVLADRVLVCPALGAPAAAMMVETLAESGVERILLAGSCGSLSAELDSGEILRVAEAVSACGTTAHYYPEQDRFPADPLLLAGLENNLHDAGLTTRAVTVVTTDAPYRETPEFVARAVSRGAQAVEMECAAVYSAARFRGVGAAAVLVVADRVLGGRWERGAGLVRYALAMRRLLPRLWEMPF